MKLKVDGRWIDSTKEPIILVLSVEERNIFSKIAEDKIIVFSSVAASESEIAKIYQELFEMEKVEDET